MPDTAPAAGGPPLPLAPAAPQMIPHSAIDASPLNPRKTFAGDELQGLADSIDREGLLQNIVLRPHPKAPGRFELVAGERRWRAVGLLIKAGRAKPDFPMPALIRPMDDPRTMLAALAENVARADLSPIEEGEHFKRLIADAGIDKADIARAIGRTVRHVELRLALVDRLHPAAQQALKDGTLDLAKARALTLAPVAKQEAILKDAVPDKKEGDRWIPLRTAEDVERRAREQQNLVGSALFELDQYKGEILEEGDRRWFGDVAQFTKLQNAAIKAKVEALEAKWAWVKVVKQHFYSTDPAVPYQYERTNAKGAGALVMVDTGGTYKPKVVTGIKKAASYAAADEKADPAKEAERKALREFGDYCRAIKTRALQRFVMTNPDAAAQLAVLQLTDSDVFGYSGFDLEGRDPAVKKMLQAYGVADAMQRGAGAKLAAAIGALSPVKRTEAFAAVVAVRLELQRDDWEKPFGEAEEAVTILRRLKFDPLRDWAMNMEFLRACPQSALDRIFDDVGAAAQAHKDPLEALRLSIIAAPKSKHYRPPWLELGTAAEIAARRKSNKKAKK